MKLKYERQSTTSGKRLVPGLLTSPLWAFRDDRQVDRLPTGFRCTDPGMVLGRYVSGCVQVCMQGEPALSALEVASGPPVVPRRVSTTRALLRGMSRVYRNHRTTPFLGLVLDEAAQLGEFPAMHAAGCFGLPPDLSVLADVGQILDHDRRAGRNRPDDLLG